MRYTHNTGFRKAHRSDMQFELLDTTILLMGDGDPQITFLRGGQSAFTPVQGMFKGGLWTIFPDGTFSFQPPEGTDVSDNPYPIEGTYTLSDGVLTFQGRRESELSASSSLDGTIRLQGDTLLLEVIFAVSSSSRKIARITQTLRFASHIDKSPTSGQNEIQVPAIYDVTLTGNVDGHSFGPINGSFKLLPLYAIDSSPFRAELTIKAEKGIGHIFWTSLHQHPHGQKLLSSKAVLGKGGLIALEAEGKVMLFYPLWSTLASVASLGDMPQSVTGQEGWLAFSLSGEHLVGEIHATGTSDHNLASTYETQFTGEKRGVQHTQKSEAKDRMTPAEWNGTWASDAFGEMTLTQQDHTVHGTYTARGGGILQGLLNNEHLDFTWQDQESQDVKTGWGFLRAISGGQTLVGFWGNHSDKEYKESVLAELLTRSSLPALESVLTSQDAMKIKYAGYDLVVQGRYDAALPLLEQALAAYSTHSQQQDSTSPIADSDLLDIAGIITRLLQCYFVLADYPTIPESDPIIQQRKSFYSTLLKHLNKAVEVYQTVLQRTIPRHTTKLLRMIDENKTTSRYWQEQLITKADVLSKEQPDKQYTHMYILADLLGSHAEHLETAQQHLVEWDAYPPSKPDAIQGR